MRKLSKVLVTGGAGFIGTNFIRNILSKESGFSGRIINLDKLTYAGNADNLIDISNKFQGTRYFFEHEDICNKKKVSSIFEKYQIDTVVHFAAESHVDRSILGPDEFINTNIIGTHTLLDAAHKFWQTGNSVFQNGVLFYHVSTDEVYGSLDETGYFSEVTPYDPRSPYSASKAASDHLVMSYYHTYGLPAIISNCSNNYGPYQFPEKFIPLMILNIIESKPLPVYGDGRNIRDWLYVDDHINAIWTILKKGMTGEKYNIGGDNEWRNIDLLYRLIDIVCEKSGLKKEEVLSTITHIKDRPGHDRRYAIDCSKLKTELDWKQQNNFENGLKKTVEWYFNNLEWIKNIINGKYKEWISDNYSSREQ